MGIVFLIHRRKLNLFTQ